VIRGQCPAVLRCDAGEAAANPKTQTDSPGARKERARPPVSEAAWKGGW
jgi:hypothetical protein